MPENRLTNFKTCFLAKSPGENGLKSNIFKSIRVAKLAISQVSNSFV